MRSLFPVLILIPGLILFPSVGCRPITPLLPITAQPIKIGPGGEITPATLTGKTTMVEIPARVEEELPGTYQSEQTRTGGETNRFYGYVYDKGTAARIESAEVEPRRVEPGDEVRLTMSYVIFTHSSDPVAVEEAREIWIGGRLWRRWESRTERNGGTYRSTLPVRLPSETKTGKHKVVYLVHTPYSRDLREAPFTVVTRQDEVK